MLTGASSGISWEVPSTVGLVRLNKTSCRVERQIQAASAWCSATRATAHSASGGAWVRLLGCNRDGSDSSDTIDPRRVFFAIHGRLRRFDSYATSPLTTPVVKKASTREIIPFMEKKHPMLQCRSAIYLPKKNGEPN